MFALVISIRKWFWRMALVVLALAVFTVAAAVAFPQNFLCVDNGAVHADAMVLLGGGSHDRPERAVELFKEHLTTRILISGMGDSGINRQFLIKSGVPPHLIEVENRSRTTKENAMDAIKLLRKEHARRVIIVTSWYHSRRALACFEHYAPEIQFYSRPSYFGYKRADWRRQNLTRRIYLEYPKLIGYWMCYGVSPF